MEKYSVIVVGERARPAWVNCVGVSQVDFRHAKNFDQIEIAPNSQTIIAIDIDNLWMAEEDIEAWVAESDDAITIVCSAESLDLARRLSKYGVEFLQFEAMTVRDWDLSCERLLARHERQINAPKVNSAKHIQTIEHVAHDLRAPLAVIADYSEILRGQLQASQNDEQARIIDVLAARVQFMTGLVDDLLLTRKTQHGNADVLGEPVELTNSLTSLIADLNLRGAGRRIQCQLELPNSVPQIFCDANHFQRMIANLGTNALKHSPAGGQVRVVVEHGVDDANVVITFVDNGPGIAPENQQRIRERFSQLPSNDMQLEAGYGLGLHIVNELVKRNGGELSLDSQLGEGSRFSIALPTSEPARLFESFVSRSVQVAQQAWISIFFVRTDATANVPANRVARGLKFDNGLTVACDDQSWAVAITNGSDAVQQEAVLSEKLAAIGVSADVKFCGCWSPVTHPEQLYRCWNDLFGIDLAATTRVMIRQQEALQRDAARVKPKVQTPANETASTIETEDSTNTVALPTVAARGMARNRALPTVNQ